MRRIERNAQQHQILPSEPLTQLSEVVRQTKTIIRQRTTRINKSHRHHFPRELPQPHRRTGLIRQPEVRRRLPHLDRLPRPLQQLQPPRQQRFLIHARELVHPNPFRHDASPSTTSVNSTYAPACTFSSSAPSRTPNGIAIAAMYPGIAAIDASNFFAALSTLSTIPVTAYRFAAPISSPGSSATNVRRLIARLRPAAPPCAPASEPPAKTQ